MPSLFYGVAGFTVAVCSNSLRKLPPMRRPWEHILYVGIGMYVGDQIEKFKETNRGYLEEMQAQRAKAQSDREARFGSGSSSVSPQS